MVTPKIVILTNAEIVILERSEGSASALAVVCSFTLSTPKPSISINPIAINMAVQFRPSIKIEVRIKRRKRRRVPGRYASAIGGKST
jgi:hypothetical protein